MKLSKYNYIFHYKEKDVYLLYNSVSNAFLELDRDSYLLMKDLETHPENLEMVEETEYLVKNHILVEDDKLVFYKKKNELLWGRYQTKSLGLTIAPTDDCNFACPYCYEKGNQKNYISEEDLDHLIAYIKSFRDLNEIHISWYGGEPLMAFDKIYDFSKKLKELDKPFAANIVTNGYLLTEEVSKKFQEIHLKSMQVTIDGKESTHNKKRMLKGGGGTFSTIIENLKTCALHNPDLQIQIRVNLDETNKNDFVDLKNYLNAELNNKNLRVYHAFVNWNISQHCKKTCGLDTGEDQANFLIGEARQKNNYFGDFFPTYNISQCMMRTIRSYIVGPTGHFYKCWHHMGHQKKAIGKLGESGINESNLYKYLNGADFLDDKDCQECFFFPVCLGGCPDLRVQNEFEGKQFDLCNIAKYKLQEFLELHYTHVTQMKQKEGVA